MVDGERDRQYPLIVFPTRERSERRNRGGGPARIQFPGPNRQRQRLTPQFRRLQTEFNAAIQASLQGLDPDLVLVIEIAGSVSEFIRAAARIEGLEWIGEWEADDIEPTADFFTDREGERVGASLFLMFSNQHAMREILALWRRYTRNPDEPFPHGLGRWKAVFSQLHAIRVWNESDRVPNALLKDWNQRLEGGAERTPFEAELWYFRQPDRRAAAERDVREVIEAAGGRISGQCVIDEIEYHAIAGDLPARAVRDVYAQRGLHLFKTREIKYVQPIAQAFAPNPEGEMELINIAAQSALPRAELAPVVAILDGVPIENHPVLDGRLLVDDPDGWSAGVPVADRVHGTAMASLVIHGDLAVRGEALPRRVYIRPILRPDRPGWLNTRRECVPDDILFTDLIHRAVRRLFEEEPVRASRIYVINLSVADSSRPFTREVSPCARLLDWLAWKYQVLFLVSCGNHANDLRLEIARNTVAACASDRLEREIIRSIDRDSINRRLLSPAESVNALTVGATYADGSDAAPIPHSVLAYADEMPSPYNAQGFGYRRSIKPDVLFPGGRLMIREQLGGNDANARVEMMGNISRRPGQCVAAPPVGNVLTPSASFSRGTSNSCAIATRTAAQIFELLQDRSAIDAIVPPEFTAVLLKTLVVHGAAWQGLGDRYELALTANPSQIPLFSNVREYVAKYIGNGEANLARAVHCNSRRATLLGYGFLPEGSADVYTFPLPSGLSGQAGMRRLTVTLSWLTPINPRHFNYRRAQLWFSFPEPNESPNILVPQGRAEVHARPAQRGTVQHEVFSGDDARLFGDRANVRVWVNCRADAGSLDDEVPYCIAVTLEVGEQLSVPVYEQVEARVRAAVRVRPR